MSAFVRALVVAVAVAIALVGFVPTAGADPNDRAAARVLDAVPLPPTAEPSEIRDRVRTYTTSATPDAVLAFLRDGLRAAGWQEKSVSKAPANNNGLGRGTRGGQGQGTTNGGAETSGEGTVGSDGAGIGPATSSQQLTGPIRARWIMSGATLRLEIHDVANGNPDTRSTDERVTTFALRARAAG